MRWWRNEKCIFHYSYLSCDQKLFTSVLPQLLNKVKRTHRINTGSICVCVCEWGHVAFTERGRDAAAVGGKPEFSNAKKKNNISPNNNIVTPLPRVGGAIAADQSDAFFQRRSHLVAGCWLSHWWERRRWCGALYCHHTRCNKIKKHWFLIRVCEDAPCCPTGAMTPQAGRWRRWHCWLSPPQRLSPSSVRTQT